MQKKTNFSKYLSFANSIADKVAIELLKNYKVGRNIFTKKENSPNQVITKIDSQIELMVRKLIKSEYPDHNIIGEEFLAEKKNSNYTWIIDPIDGTKAYIAGVPVFTFLLSLKYKNKFTVSAKKKLSKSSYSVCRDIAKKIAVDQDNSKLLEYFIKRQDTLRNISIDDYFNLEPSCFKNS